MAKKKTKKATRKKTGRPLANVDARQVEALASICCSQEEIGLIVGCSVDTLHRRFAEVIEIGMARACAGLRRQQFKQAMNGNTGMLVWLGKQLLKQRDKSDINTDGTVTLAISETIVPTRANIGLSSNGNGHANGNGHKANGAIPATSRLPGPN